MPRTRTHAGACHVASAASACCAMQDNFDREEVDKFEAMAESWWDENGKFRPLHRINPLRLDYIAAAVDLAGADVLDVGCGGGLLAEGMARRGASVTGIDRSPKALGVARLHAGQSGVGVEYAEADAESWSQTHAGGYDVVTCMEVLEHVPDVPRTVRACSAMLRPGGLFFFATINRTPQAWLKAILGAEYILGWLPKGTHRYDRFIRPSEMRDACRKAALEVREIRGMSYALLSDRFSLSADLSVNYLGRAEKNA